MPDTTLRQITMLSLLPRRSPGRTTGDIQNALAERDFEVTRRTIQRDLLKLSGAFPLVYEEGTENRWHWAAHSNTLSVPGHDPYSALTWQLIEKYLKPVLPRSMVQEAEPQFRSARDFLKGAGAGKFRRWTQRVRLLPRTMPLHAPEIDSGILDAVYQALLEKRQLRITYRSRSTGELGTWSIHPLALVVRDSVHYLLATIWEFTDPRQLALHRVHSAELLDEPVSEPKDFDLDQYIRDGGFDYSHGKQIRLVARFEPYAAEALIETPLAKDQTHRALKDKRVEFKATVNDSEQLRWWLMGFGSGVEVMRPKHLREFMRKDAERLMQLYDPS